MGAMYSFLNIILGYDILYFFVNEKLKLISSFSHIVNSNTLNNVTLGRYFRKRPWLLQQFESAAAGGFRREEDGVVIEGLADLYA